METLRTNRVNSASASSDKLPRPSRSLRRVWSQFARDNAQPFLGNRIFHPEKAFGQQLAKAPVNLADARCCIRSAASKPAAVDPFLDGDVRPGFQLQVPLSGILAVVLSERPLD